MIHIDIKNLGRFDRVAIDHHSRIAFSQILPDERKDSMNAFCIDFRGAI